MNEQEEFCKALKSMTDGDIRSEIRNIFENHPQHKGQKYDLEALTDDAHIQNFRDEVIKPNISAFCNPKGERSL